MKFIIGLAFVFILGALGSAGWFMLKRPSASQAPDGAVARPQDNRMARALALRVGISVAVFLIVLVGYGLGWIQPTGMPISR